MQKSSTRILAAMSLVMASSLASAQTAASPAELVTVENYNRAQTDVNFAGVVKNGGFFSIAAFVKSNLTSFRFSFAFGSALADSVPGGSCFSSRSAPGRLMMGLEGWVVQSLERPCR